MPDNSAKIAEIEEILNSGATSTSVDGLSVSIDLEALRRRLIELKRTDTSGGTPPRRPKIYPYRF